MQDIKNKLSYYISDNRVQHSLSVATKAVELATIYNVNQEKAYLAGLIHDAAKEFSPQKCIDHNIILTDFKTSLYKQHKAVWHALIVDQFAPVVFDIHDTDVLSAAKKHTTGAKNMSILDKIIFIADCIEPLRGVEIHKDIETVARKSLNDAVYIILSRNIHFLIKSQQTIYEDTIACYNNILNSINIDKNLIDEFLK